MSSTVSNYINRIDQEFPVAGQDNDSQVFRDNFKNIFQAFYFIDQDLEEIKTGNVSKLAESNDFSRNTILRANFQNCSTQIFNDIDAKTADVLVDYSEGSYQKYILAGGTHVFGVENWPGNLKSGSITLAISTSTTEPTLVDFAGYATNVGAQPWPVEITNSPQFFELWSDGETLDSYYVRQVNHNDQVLLNSQGYQKTAGGMTIEWGSFTAFHSTTGTVAVTTSFSMSFPSAVVSITGSAVSTDPTAVFTPTFSAISTTSFTANCYSSAINATTTYYYTAIGF